jgi:hypothetical protein
VGCVFFLILGADKFAFCLIYSKENTNQRKHTNKQTNKQTNKHPTPTQTMHKVDSTQKRKRASRGSKEAVSSTKTDAKGKTHHPPTKRAKPDAHPSHFDALPEEMVERVLDLATGPDRTDDCELLLTRVACRMVCTRWNRVVRPPLPHLALLPRALAAGLPNLFDWTLSMAAPNRGLDLSSPDSLRAELLLWACAGGSVASLAWLTERVGTFLADCCHHRFYVRKCVLVAMSRGHVHVLRWLKGQYGDSECWMRRLFNRRTTQYVFEAASLVPDPQQAIQVLDWADKRWPISEHPRVDIICKRLLRYRALHIAAWWAEKNAAARRRLETIGWNSIVRCDHTLSYLLSLSETFPSSSRPVDEQAMKESLFRASEKAALRLLGWLDDDGSLPARGGPPDLAKLLELPSANLAFWLTGGSVASVGTLSLLAKMAADGFCSPSLISFKHIHAALDSFGPAPEVGERIFAHGRWTEVAKRMGIPYERSWRMWIHGRRSVAEMRDVLAKHGSLWTEKEIAAQLAYSPQHDRGTILGLVQAIERLDIGERDRVRERAMWVATRVQDTELMAQLHEGCDDLDHFVGVAATCRCWRAMHWMLDNGYPTKASHLEQGLRNAVLDAETDMAARFLSLLQERKQWLNPCVLEAVCCRAGADGPNELFEQMLSRKDFAVQLWHMGAGTPKWPRSVSTTGGAKVTSPECGHHDPDGVSGDDTDSDDPTPSESDSEYDPDFGSFRRRYLTTNFPFKSDCEDTSSSSSSDSDDER